MTIRLGWMNRWGELPEIADRGLRAIGDTPTRERALLLAASGVGLALGADRYLAGSKLLADAEQMATELGEEALLGSVLLQKVYADWAFIQFPGKYDAAFRATDLFRSAGRTWSLADVLSNAQLAAFSVGRLDDIARIAEELEPLARRLDQWAAQLLYIQAVGPRELLVSGDAGRLHQWGEEHLALCEKVGFPWTNLSYDFMGLADFWRGRRSDALKNLEHASRVEMPGPWGGVAPGSLFQVRAFFGDPEARASFREDGLPTLGEPSGIGSWRYLTGAVQALSYLGEDEEAAELYPLTTQAIDTGTVMLHFGFDLLEKIAGIAATAAHDWPAAETHFENALKQAEAIPHKLDQCEVRYWYGKMLTKRGSPGDRDKTRQLLDEAIDGYRSIGMPLHLEMAEELRAKL
jgi:tetratricopeptide (TPR) repeat protein